MAAHGHGGLRGEGGLGPLLHLGLLGCLVDITGWMGACCSSRSTAGTVYIDGLGGCVLLLFGVLGCLEDITACFEEPGAWIDRSVVILVLVACSAGGLGLW